MQFRFLTIIALFFFIVTTFQSQVKLPDTPQGKTVQEYFEAFNSGDEAVMKNFFLNHISKEGLAERPVEMRIERMKTFRTDAKSLTLTKVLDVGETAITVLVKSGQGETLTMTFQFEDNPEHTLGGISVEMGEVQPASGPPLNRKQFIAEVKKYLDEQVRKDAFSGAVLIQRGNDQLFKQAYGEAEKRHHIPNRTDTKFNIGSINKYFTRIAIGQLYEQGKLSLDDRVGKFLPDYPNAAVAEKVTIEQLLTMQSGMGDIFGEKFDNAAKDKIRTLKDYLQFFVNDSLLFEPGTNRRYSNAGYIVLGLIIEKLSGEDYYSYVKKHIFEPAGMTNSDWYPLSSITPNLATGYLHPEGDENTWISNVHFLPERGSSAGGCYSTLDDLKNLIHALLNGKLLSAKYSQWVVTGILPTNNPTLPLKEGGFGMAGGTAGANAVLDFEASSGDIIVVLSNYDPPTAEVTAKALSDLLKRLK